MDAADHVAAIVAALATIKQSAECLTNSTRLDASARLKAARQRNAADMDSFFWNTVVLRADPNQHALPLGAPPRHTIGCEPT